MTGGSRIVAIGAGAEEAAPRTEPVLELETPLEAEYGTEPDYADEPDPAAPRARWVLPTLAFALVAAWSAFFVWANFTDLASGFAPKAAIALVTQWAVPVLLVGIAWLIATRSSRREALRFGEAARVLSDEAARLEDRLLVVNRELSLAREFLSAQSRDLESLGRIASERISEHADRLQGLVRDNGSQVDAIATVSTTALDNMERLRGQLPVIASSAKDVANNIGNAGRTAQLQLKDMVDGLNRLNEFTMVSEHQVESLRLRVDEAIAALGTNLERMRGSNETAFAEIEQRQTAFSETLSSGEAEMLAGIAARSAALLDELNASRKLIDEQEAQSLTSLRARLGTLRDEAGALSRALRDGEAGAMEAFSRSREQLDTDIAATFERLDALDRQAVETARERIAALAEEAERFDARLAERNRAYDDELAERARKAAAGHEEDAERISALLASVSEALDGHDQARTAQIERVAAQNRDIEATIEASVARATSLAAEVGGIESTLANSLAALTANLGQGRDAVHAAQGAVIRLTDDSVRLLELLQASAQQTSESLPQALTNSGEHLAALEARIELLAAAVTDAGDHGARLADSVETTRTAIGQSLGEIQTLQSGLEQGSERHGNRLAALKDVLTELESQTTALATASQENLSEAIERLSASVRDAVTTIEQTGGKAIAGIAERLGEESASAIDRVLRARTAEAVGALEEASAHAAGVSRESALLLRDQLAKIDALTGNLERRITQARERAEEQVDNDFARRMALITESLNSNAIDVAKALSSEVTDTAWAAYLRGDRGVFTRRAVRLIDTAEARSIAAIYGEDPEFREHVSRYIHDFEAMLRQLLSTRDGHALSVTLLSSDMGKLYVALAQAIERLRG